jgi:hypothetical protein
LLPLALKAEATAASRSSVDPACEGPKSLNCLADETCASDGKIRATFSEEGGKSCTHNIAGGWLELYLRDTESTEHDKQIP